METKQSREGWLLIDHRESPGLDDDTMWRANPELPAGAGKGLFETAFTLCGHCQTVKLVDTKRNMLPPYCPKCDHYVCERCKLVAVVSGECKPFVKVIDETQELASRGRPIPLFNPGRPSGLIGA